MTAPALVSSRRHPSSNPVSALPTLGAREFALLRDLVEREAGIHLSETKKALVFSRLVRRLRELELPTFLAYYRYVTEAEPGELEELLNRICTNETHFFRDPRQFEFLETRMLDAWAVDAAQGHRPRRLRVWSAACSTGEEPYSVAMALLQRFPAGSGWEIDILATDLSTRVLRRANDGLWPIEKAAEIPAAHRKAFMLKGTGPQERWMKASPGIRSLVRFQRFNLNDEGFAPGGPFDLILCRNVLIYFGKAARLEVLQRLLGQLAPEGYLFLGHAESLAALPGVARAVGPAIYMNAGHGTRTTHRDR